MCNNTAVQELPKLCPLPQRWREEGKRGIWLKIPAQKAQYVGIAVDCGFEFHHAEKVGKPGSASSKSL
jgi:hypothetical protein